MSNSDRGRRRRNLRTARRARQFIDMLATTREDVSDIKERRPPDTAVTKLRTVQEAGVALDDVVSVTELSEFLIEWDNPDTSPGYSEYQNEFTDDGGGDGGDGGSTSGTLTVSGTHIVSGTETVESTDSGGGGDTTTSSLAVTDTHQITDTESLDSTNTS